MAIIPALVFALTLCTSLLKANDLQCGQHGAALSLEHEEEEPVHPLFNEGYELSVIDQ